ncbi:hypothetical protein POF50_015255 [Streptomyces sp. SL13]|uniref:Uncharacterized protein n=1 Tax=Streptantibioticus silvisoli TaxID=2705255 RepID=A0AA90KGK0_9ACTN|nr:hypothetical protein [Streptantibioticus silvisoli]MDI5970680.1 hypothetical protein [Streptantibioticus silvisoli]
MTTVTPADADQLFDTACKAADAVLFEGYVLYPYRASAAKNRMRWQFGVLVPPSWDGHRGEHSTQRTECLMEPRGDAEVTVRLRFLRVRRRTVLRCLPGGGHAPADSLDLPDRVLVPWGEGVEERVDVTATIEQLCGAGVEAPVGLPADEDTEEVYDATGAKVGRLVRRGERVDAVVRLTATELPGPYRVLRLTVVVENTGDWTAEAGGDTSREAALPYSLVAAHLMIGLTSGSFVSMTDPPEWARAAVADCRNDRTWPVLAGVDGRADVMLSSPIILEDHPRIAPESPGALYDSLEIDEILALRTAALTDQEKREARGTDERAGAVVDLADSLPPEVLERLHGAVRSLREATGEVDRPDEPPVLTTPDPDGPPVLTTPVRDEFPVLTAPHPDGFPDLTTPVRDELPVLTAPHPDEPLAPSTPDPDEGLARALRPDAPWWDPAADRSVDPARDRVLVDGRSVGAGSRVRLRPGQRRTDAQDIFLHGRTALVEAVLHDVDGAVHLAVTVEDDPGAELRRLQGRFLYFQPDEVSVLPTPSGTPGGSDSRAPA